MGLESFDLSGDRCISGADLHSFMSGSSVEEYMISCSEVKVAPAHGTAIQRSVPQQKKLKMPSASADTSPNGERCAEYPARS